MGLSRYFKGVWIPKDIWINNNLTVMEKLFLVEIDSLDNDKGCFASNKHFSEFFDISKGRCTQIIKSLEEKKLITISYEYENKQIKHRLIRVVNKLNTPVNKLNRGSKYSKQGYLENDDDSNTSNSNTSNSNTKERRNSAKAKYPDDSPYYLLAVELYNLMLLNNENAKEPNFQKWADDFRKMIEIDKRDQDHLREVMQWSQRDSFWKGNILSANKLRQKFDQLAVQSGKAKPYKKIENELDWE